MGLDNGIVLEKKRSTLPRYITYDFIGSDNFLELCYWRKCWGIRNRILAIDFENEKEPWEDNGIYYLTPKDVYEIQKVLFYFLKKKNWEREAGSIWTYEEIWPRLVKHIFRLIWLERYLKKNPDAVCYFYDSW